MLAIHSSTNSTAPDAGDRCNLRAWFAVYLLWLGGWTAAAIGGLAAVEHGGSPVGWGVWMLALYTFYLSLCCTFVPLPTTWFILLVASDLFAARVGLAGDWIIRLLLVATLGAVATAMANLNEYHVFTYLLRFRRVARLRDTRTYRSAARWFGTSPFWVIVLFAFLPIPVDVVRWLAITCRYARVRYFAGYFCGRWVRYAILALSAVWFKLTPWQIVWIQAALAALVLGRIVFKFARKKRSGPPHAPARLGGPASAVARDEPPA